MARIATPATDTPPRRLARQINRAAGAHGLDPALLGAVVMVESGFDPRAESPNGARGLLQLMPARARALGVSDPCDAAATLDAGARCLASKLRAYRGDLHLVLAAYHLGADAVERHGGVPPYSEMQAFLPKVMGYYDDFRATGVFARPAEPRNGSGTITDGEGRC